MDVNVDSIVDSMNGAVPEGLSSFVGFPIVLIAVLVLGLLALYSYRIFRITLTLGGAIAFGLVGSIVIAPLLKGMIGELPLGFQMEYVLGFIFALIGGVTMKFFFKVALFVSGAGVGWMFGTSVCAIVQSFLPDVEFFSQQIGVWVIDGICAIIVGVLSLFLFKFIYIVSTSLGGMVGAAVLIVSTVKPQAGGYATAVAVLIGIIAGIISAVNQYKTSGDSKSKRNEQE